MYSRSWESGGKEPTGMFRFELNWQNGIVRALCCCVLPLAFHQCFKEDQAHKNAGSPTQSYGHDVWAARHNAPNRLNSVWTLSRREHYRKLLILGLYSTVIKTIYSWMLFTWSPEKYSKYYTTLYAYMIEVISLLNGKKAVKRIWSEYYWYFDN